MDNIKDTLLDSFSSNFRDSFVLIVKLAPLSALQLDKVSRLLFLREVVSLELREISLSIKELFRSVRAIDCVYDVRL